MLNKNKILILTTMGMIANLSSNTNAQTFYQCLPCPAGTYASNGTCTPCPAGTYSQVSGATSSAVCSACPDYQWSNPGATKCGRVFVAYTLTGFRDSNRGIVNARTYEWVNIESFNQNKYCAFGISNNGFLAKHHNGFVDPDSNIDYGNFGVNQTIGAITAEDNGNDWLKGNCTRFPCNITGGRRSFNHSYTTIDPANNLITQHYLNGSHDNISGAIKIVDDEKYWNRCFGPK
ncbi:hypothetical protein HDR59_01595 [bacterium]|nr:hypothetical protein [bacterium]